ncbi:uncharacterized protein BKA78DRAFT_377468 [Phyllosticta capitalensis]
MARLHALLAIAFLGLMSLFSIAFAQNATATATMMTDITSSVSTRSTTAASTTTGATTKSGNAVSVVTSIDSSKTTHTIAVNKEEGKFDPDSLLADVGDYVAFQFYPGNHSVARSAFGYPCIPIGLTSNKSGFWSGWKPFVAGDLPEYVFRINRVEPLWYYDAAPGYCQKYSMVGVINPTNTNQLAFQSSLAGATTLALAPGEPLPSSFSNAVTFDSSSAATNTNLSSPSTPSPSSSISGGAIAGTVVGSIAGLAAVVALIFLLLRRRKQRQDKDRKLKEAMEASALADAMAAKSPSHRTSMTPRSAGSSIVPGRGIDSVISGGLWADGEGTWRSTGSGGVPGVVSPWQQTMGPLVEAGGNEVVELSQFGDGETARVELPTPPPPPDKKRPFSYEGPYEMGADNKGDEKDAVRRKEKE